MKIKSLIGTTLLAALFSACAQEDITPEINSNGKATLKIVGEMPSEGNKNSRAYIGDDKGVYWMPGDRISVIPEALYMFGIDLPFVIAESDAGKPSGTFICTGDLASYAPNYFKAGTKFVSCYPELSVRSTTPNNSQENIKRCTMPGVYYQNGITSNHLWKYIFMFSGEMELEKDIEADEYKQYLLPKITFKHKSAIHRFRVTNRQAHPIDLKSVKLTSLKAGTTDTYPIFIIHMDINLNTLVSKPFNNNMSPDNYSMEVQLSQEGKNYYTLKPGESMYVYGPTFAANLNAVDLQFSVTDNNGNTYNTLALPGSKIKNGKFEEGYCYTYDLLVDNKLTLQDWNVDFIGNVNLGQQSFTLSTDCIVLPLDGNRRETITVNTSDADGWNITDMPEWASASITSGGAGESQITFSATSTTDKREEEICITSGNLKKYIRIVQSDKTNFTDAIYLTKADMQNKDITSYILTDDEPTNILHNESLRSFKTTEPLQSGITEDKKLHLRFYSPRKLTDVQVWASVPGIMEEEFLLAELEEMAPFADVYAALPAFGEKDLHFRTLSGKEITFKAGPTFSVRNMKLRISSSCSYWKMLQDIKVTWNVSFSGYHPFEHTSPDYIMQGAHCREGVALALNNTYMFSTNEYRDYVFSMQGRLIADAEGLQIVDTRDLYYNRILKTYPIKFGLTKLAGFTYFGGGRFFVLEEAYLTHYADDVADKHNYVIWHEFAHVLGYDHVGNMTFPPADDEEYGWSILTADFYHKMSAAKKLPIYSRRFLHTRDRKGSSLYGNKWKVNEKHSFGTTPEEDAELYEIDRGQLWYF